MWSYFLMNSLLRLTYFHSIVMYATLAEKFCCIISNSFQNNITKKYKPVSICFSTIFTCLSYPFKHINLVSRSIVITWVQWITSWKTCEFLAWLLIVFRVDRKRQFFTKGINTKYGTFWNKSADTLIALSLLMHLLPGQQRSNTENTELWKRGQVWRKGENSSGS